MDTRRETTTVKEPHLDFLLDEMKMAKDVGVYTPSSASLISPACFSDDNDDPRAGSIGFAQSLGNLGAMIGFAPLLVTLGFVITEAFSNSGPWNPSYQDLGAWVGLSLISSIFGSTIGYALGKSIGTVLSDTRKKKGPFLYALAIPFFGSFWGILSGAAAGLPIFLIGAFFGAFIGAAVGIAASVFMALVFELLSENRRISVGLSLPLSVGFVFFVLALMFGTA